MRKYFFLMVFFILALPVSQAAEAVKWKEGVHYNEIPFPLTVETGKNIEVREYFWYGCPHCFNLEPTINSWRKQKPKGTEFVRSPAILGPSWQLHAVAYFSYEALGIVDKMHQPTFDAIHKHKRALVSVDDLADLAAEHGVDRAKFIKATRSFGVRVKLQHQKQMDSDAGIRSVPAIVVDGKYRTGADLAGGEDNLFKLIDYLVQKAKQERKKKQ